VDYQPQSVLLQSREKFGKRPPMDFCGDVFRRIHPIMSHSVRMAFEGRSAGVGAPPDWLKRASDIRILGFAETDGDTLLELEARTLGDAAPELYKQKKFWDDLPGPEETALNVMSRVMSDVRNKNPDSARYDLPLLKVTHTLSALFNRDLELMRLPQFPGDSQLSGVIDESVPYRALELSNCTPNPREVRVAGTVDMVRYSTRAFALKLQDGKEIHGVLENAELVQHLSQFLNKEVVVVGKAIYRPSGSLLRIDAKYLEEIAKGSALFSRIPYPISPASVTSKGRSIDTAKSNVAAFFGSWPGEESDEQLLAALKELRG
jgi:hypothetical protein